MLQNPPHCSEASARRCRSSRSRRARTSVACTQDACRQGEEVETDGPSKRHFRSQSWHYTKPSRLMIIWLPTSEDPEIRTHYGNQGALAHSASLAATARSGSDGVPATLPSSSFAVPGGSGGIFLAIPGDISPARPGSSEFVPKSAAVPAGRLLRFKQCCPPGNAARTAVTFRRICLRHGGPRYDAVP